METWVESWRDKQREPPTFNRDAVMLVFIKTAPRVFTTLLHTDSLLLPDPVWLLLRTITDAGRRESTRDFLAKIILVHAASSTLWKITQKTLRKEQTKRVLLRTDHRREATLSYSSLFDLKILLCGHTAARLSSGDNWRILSRSGSCWVSSAATDKIKNEQSVADKLPRGSSLAYCCLCAVVLLLLLLQWLTCFSAELVRLNPEGAVYPKWPHQKKRWGDAPLRHPWEEIKI